ncbi:peptide deformylase [Catenisphaera adipataccumulans]|jgi:peptide deformylase|uniref:Peptide deformylase n=1 Tax=Catenisphaera adipataccumulans TaxID=700500 RepID=A0A7W8FUF2_9FIRM|nr:peptide deformylase [Catenisphaera adipataccumulans]MBB5182033.1 peptide deformylase [Catenisphaera adipataccumulans]
MKIHAEDIILDSNPLIRRHSEKVSLPLSDEDRGILQALLDYVHRSQDEETAEKEGIQPAVGIAAIQIGIPKQLIAVVVPEEDGVKEAALANPKIISESVQNSYLQNGEGCLSVPDEHEGHVFRHARVTVRGYDLIQDQEVKIRASGYFAIALQHEIDHLSGKLFYDRIDPKDPWKSDPEAEVI